MKRSWSWAPTRHDPDTDGGGVPDGVEVDRGTDPLDPTDDDPEVDLDSDDDGLTDAEEAELGTDPFDADTDDDGLTDGEEVNDTETDPLEPDTDGGGVPDGIEVERGTNPLDPTDDQSGQYLGGACGGCSSNGPGALWLGLLGVIGLVARRRRSEGGADVHEPFRPSAHWRTTRSPSSVDV